MSDSQYLNVKNNFFIPIMYIIVTIENHLFETFKCLFDDPISIIQIEIWFWFKTILWAKKNYVPLVTDNWG